MLLYLQSMATEQTTYSPIAKQVMIMVEEGCNTADDIDAGWLSVAMDEGSVVEVHGFLHSSRSRHARV